MTKPAHSPGEPARLRALEALAILDTPPEPAFDGLARLAASALATPIAQVTFVDSTRKWAKASVGAPAGDMRREDSFCDRVIEGGFLVVPDAWLDPRFADLGVVGSLGVRFYAGAPVTVEGGLVVGAVCVADQRPRDLDERGRAMLELLAGQVSELLAQRKRGREVERAAAAALRDSAERYRSLVQSLDGIVWELDAATFRFTFVSPQSERIMGYPPEAWYREGFWVEHLHPDDRQRTVAACHQATEGCQDHTLDYRMRTADGRYLWVRDVVSVIADEAGQPSKLRGIIFDVTHTRRLEEGLREAATMEALGRLASGVAHDFNNVLMGIMVVAEQLTRAPSPSSCHGPALEILGLGRRAASFSRQLLAFGRKQPLCPERVDLNVAVTEAMTMLRRLLGAHIDIETSLAPERAAVLIDPTQLSRVLLNLALNARDAMPEGGPLLLETRADEPGVATIVVRDSGAGIAPEVRPRIFEPFFSTKPDGQGSGMGLSIVHGIVAQSGGSIEVESEPGRGTTFVIRLPRASEPDDALGEGDAPPPSARDAPAQNS